MKGSNPNAKGRPGAVRKGSRGKQVGSGGQGRQALEGKKPTPKAEDRPYHPAGKRKAAAERYTAANPRAGAKGAGAKGTANPRGASGRTGRPDAGATAGRGLAARSGWPGRRRGRVAGSGFRPR